MGVIDSSALCLAKLPAPLMLNHSLGSQALCLPMREEDLPFYLGPYTPQPHVPSVPLLPLACFSYPVPMPTCQVSLGNPTEAGVPIGLGQARSLVPATTSLQWAWLGLC